MIKKLMEPWKQMFKHKGISVELNEDESVLGCSICSDWRLYQMILFNILQNSIKYNRQNGQIQINLSLNLIEGQNMFETIVKDTGIGIEQQKVLNLLKPKQYAIG